MKTDEDKITGITAVLAWTAIVGFLVLMALCGCSHLSQVTSAETHQAAAMVRVRQSGNKVEKDNRAQLAEIANLATQERIVLSLPPTDQTNTALDALALDTLTLAGAPNENETRLKAEVQALMTGGQIQQNEIARLDGVVAALQKTHAADVAANQKAQSALTTTTTKLYQVATAGAEAADFSSSIFKWVLICLALLALWVLARIALKITATVAAKAP
jgi:hypothetical protein